VCGTHVFTSSQPVGCAAEQCTCSGWLEMVIRVRICRAAPLSRKVSWRFEGQIQSLPGSWNWGGDAALHEAGWHGFQSSGFLQCNVVQVCGRPLAPPRWPLAHIAGIAASRAGNHVLLRMHCAAAGLAATSHRRPLQPLPWLQPLAVQPHTPCMCAACQQVPAGQSAVAAGGHVRARQAAAGGVWTQQQGGQSCVVGVHCHGPATSSSVRLHGSSWHPQLALGFAGCSRSSASRGASEGQVAAPARSVCLRSQHET
jgi:hypothetical protein